MKLDKIIESLYIGIIVSMFAGVTLSFFDSGKCVIICFFLAIGLFVATLLLSFVNMALSCRNKA